MDLTEFRASTAAAEPPAGLSLPLQTLWWEAKGDWNRAHECAQEDRTPSGSIVHAYLHRVEGDLSNAGGWYNRSGRPVRWRMSGPRWRKSFCNGVSVTDFRGLAPRFFSDVAPPFQGHGHDTAICPVPRSMAARA